MLEQKCWMCGETIPDNEYYGQTRRYCEKCYEKHTEAYKPILTEYTISKNRVTFERAMRLMEKACCDMTKYKRYATAVMKHSHVNPEQYRSADEMITAVVLMEAGYNFMMNVPVGRYRVDFLVPSLKICIEVDGDRHKYRKAEDGKRDVEIRAALGKEWEIIRIPCTYLEKNPEKVPEAIKAIYDLKKEIRAKNNGILPETYSKREKMYYEQNTLEYRRKTNVI